MKKQSCMVVCAVGAGVLIGGCTPNGTSASPSPAPAMRSESGSEPTRAFAAAPSDASPQPVSSVQVVPSDPVVARANGKPITMNQLQKPLIEGYGLNILLNLVQLELAKQMAEKAHVVVSPEDIINERDDTLSKMFQGADKSEHEQLMEQFLQQQRISRPEFDIVIETTTYLRKMAEPQMAGKITDANLEEAFRQLYGETVKVRHIQCANMTEILEAKRRLAEGQPFEQVAVELSRNERTRGVGGELPSFSRASAGFPQAFKDTAFSLQPGEVSDPVQADGAFHLIKLENRIPPKAVKFEDVKESVRLDLEDRVLQTMIKQMRGELAQQSLLALQIDDPVMKAQFDARKSKREAQVRDREQLNKDLERERERIRLLQEKLAHETTQPATFPEPEPGRAPPPPTSQPSAPATQP